MRHSVTPVRTACLLAAGVAGLSLSGSWCSKANAQTLSALTTFGSNGWLAPGSNAYVTTDNSQRGMGWNPVTKNIVLPSRSGGNFVAIINGTTGIVSGTLDTTGVSGGTLAMMGAGVSDDGAIYVPNLQSGSSALSPFKIYSWTGESDTNAPSIAFSQVNPQTTSGAFRFADAFAVYGSGTSLKFAAAGSTSSGTTAGLPNNSNFMIGSLDGLNTNTIYRNIPNTLTSSNDYRLGITFVDADTIIGNQGTSAKITDFVAATTLSNTGAIVTGSIAMGAADRPLDYTVINGQALLAVVNSNSSLISIYDITNPAAAALLTTGSTVSGALTANANATGGVQWGEMLTPTSQVLYAMSTNQGIQAMVFQAVPEPSTYAMMGGAFAVIGVIASRKRKIVA
ncbi:MAG: DUF4623 domain-containing protein [Planctomycetota bacterium]|nr:MAG: DUF4623 domain-containing protein [Planctomycetota bacterium]